MLRSEIETDFDKPYQVPPLSRTKPNLSRNTLWQTSESFPNSSSPVITGNVQLVTALTHNSKHQKVSQIRLLF